MQIDEYRALFLPESFHCHRFNQTMWEVVMFAHRLLARKYRPVMVDVGAGMGAFSLLAVIIPDLTVHAFEPNPTAAELLQQNVQITGVADRVHIHETALMHQAGRATLKIPAGGERDGRATLGTPYQFASGVQMVKVECQALDDLHIGRADLLKLDIEGAELLALWGAQRWLERHHPAVIAETQDVRTIQFGYKFELINGWMKQHGYEKRRLGRDTYYYHDDSDNTVI